MLTTTMLTVNLDRPIVSTILLGDSATDSGHHAVDPAAAAELDAQIERYQHLCDTLQNTVSQVSRFYEELVAGHSEAIAKLSTEIARKVIMRNIDDGDYKIEAIVTEALKNAPGPEDVLIRLNPQDLTECQNAQQDAGSPLAGVELQADPGIGRGECVLESPKGIVKSLIDEHLERISTALAKTE
jgi:flagellar biosynthesis/type III secretory pathway protein FliH